MRLPRSLAICMLSRLFSIQSLTELYSRMAAKMFSLASCGEGLDMSKTASALCLKVYRIAVMLFYDIAITFGDEVEKIWKQRFTGATVLWFMVSDVNRILPPSIQ